MIYLWSTMLVMKLNCFFKFLIKKNFQQLFVGDNVCVTSIMFKFDFAIVEEDHRKMLIKIISHRIHKDNFFFTWDSQLLITSIIIELMSIWEKLIYFRFPPEISSKVQKFVDEDSRSNDRLSLKFNDDLRSGIVQFDQNSLPFKLYDLPTITEVVCPLIVDYLNNKSIFLMNDSYSLL